MVDLRRMARILLNSLPIAAPAAKSPSNWPVIEGTTELLKGSSSLVYFASWFVCRCFSGAWQPDLCVEPRCCVDRSWEDFPVDRSWEWFSFAALLSVRLRLVFSKELRLISFWFRLISFWFLCCWCVGCLFLGVSLWFPCYSSVGWLLFSFVVGLIRWLLVGCWVWCHSSVR